MGFFKQNKQIIYKQNFLLLQLRPKVHETGDPQLGARDADDVPSIAPICLNFGQDSCYRLDLPNCLKFLERVLNREGALKSFYIYVTFNLI